MVVSFLRTKSDLNSAAMEKSSRIQRGIHQEVGQEAKQWNNYVDTLKRTVNSMHEICLAKQNVLGCEEALMYLTSAVRDFQSLISSINVELEWENSENRPSTVSWEVIGTNRRKCLSTKQLTENSSIQQKSMNDSCVQCRAKRRMNADLSDDENSKKTDVYERLAYGKRSNNVVKHSDIMDELKKQGCTTGKLITPRSAMEIPQTKSSMAKIAASRQLLWQRHKKILTEKLSAKRRQEHSLATLGNRRRSLPMLAKEVVSVKTTVETNLESIHEAHEDDKPEPGDIDNTSTKTHAGHFKTRSDGYFDLLDMSFDDEWKALTEEEESLAQEEESLKKEIEETESISIDEELQRRVILDFSDVASESDWQSVVGNWTIDNSEIEDAELMRESAVETPKLVQRQQLSSFRQPGELVKIHQRLLSPLRKRNLDAEEIQKRQNRAEELRLMLQEQKAQRLRILLSKVEDVRQKRERLLEKKRLHLENKMQKAAENRQKNLDEIIKKAKDDDQRVLETNFINKMENERARLDLQLREKEQEQRLLNLAEERSKQVRFKASKEAALDERKRTAEQQKTERLHAQAIKKQERQNLIEAQRNEAVEFQRKKLRLYEQKIENIKSNEIMEAENLRNKIQEKANKGAKRHEILVERIRQKAIESSRLNVFSSLADCAVPPSDLQYSLIDNNCCKTCIKCDYLATSDLNLIGHLLSTEHLSKDSLELKDFNFIYLKSELENIIRIVDGNALVENETLEVPTLNRKLRAKIKQKLASVDLQLDFNVSNSTFRQSFDKKSAELRNLLSEHSKINEQGRKKFEHCLSDMRRCFIDQTLENRNIIATFAHQSGLIVSLIDFMVRNQSNALEYSSKVFYRMICKISNFLLEISMTNSKVCCNILFTDRIYNLLEWSTNQIEIGISNSTLDECSDTIVSIFCLLSAILKEGSTFVQTELTQFSSQLDERLQSIATYLTNSNFIVYYKHIVTNGIEPIEFGFGHSIRPLNILSGFVATLDSQMGEKPQSQILNLHLMTIQSLILEIYAKIRFDVVHSGSSNSGTLMTTSLMSTNSSNWHSNSNVEVECSALFLLWNSLNIKISSDSPVKQKILENIKDDEALRFVYILLVSIYNADKSVNSASSSNIGPLTEILKATAYFASLSSKHQLICTIGWQKSLLVQICKLPFEFFQNPSMRFHLLTALIVILFENREGISLIREYITSTWMAEFLKELINSNGQSNEEEHRRFEQLIPEKKWRSGLEFFENTQL